MLAEFAFANTKEAILNIFKLSDTTVFNDSKDKDGNKRHRHGKLTVLPTSIEQLKLRKPKIDTCIVVTTKAVYKIVVW